MHRTFSVVAEVIFQDREEGEEPEEGATKAADEGLGVAEPKAAANKADVVSTVGAGAGEAAGWGTDEERGDDASKFKLSEGGGVVMIEEAT